MTRIALISATPAAIGPATAGLGREFPDATVWNILDDRLLADANAAGGLTPPLAARMGRLIEHALAEGADGVLLTCSLYGSVAQSTSAAVPVLAPDEAAFAAAIDGGYSRVLVVASVRSALDDSVRRFGAACAERGSSTQVLGIAVPAAFDATTAGDEEALLTALVAACREFLRPFDAVLLAQYSLAPVASRLADALFVPVVSGPDSAARTLRGLVAGKS
ncbi:aspartate/glutamate racemase family protein [Pseudonocardia sp. TRM90224]|uniref:aspartate/glutamate racemase family protein n=1 Tax=Pseudonocardia sp. TRM90224 TaxID=2812678 RepID=UPI001E3CD8D9|nr:aspartate/glutamate racemase family protein [Pseudonocardia sp. TRM90224]